MEHFWALITWPNCYCTGRPCKTKTWSARSRVWLKRGNLVWEYHGHVITHHLVGGPSSHKVHRTEKSSFRWKNRNSLVTGKVNTWLCYLQREIKKTEQYKKKKRLWHNGKVSFIFVTHSFSYPLNSVHFMFWAWNN